MASITLRPTPKQYQAWSHLTDKDCKYVVFGGGAGGGKSWLGCEWILTNCYQYPGSKWFIGREELKRLMSSTYVTWLKVCQFHKVPVSDWRLNGQYNYIEFVDGAAKGSRVDLLDVKYFPSDPLYERFGSTEYTGGWLEEAGEIDFTAFDVLKTRVGRHMNRDYSLPSKILITCNPKKNWLYQEVYKPEKEGRMPPEYSFVQSLYKDNPYTAEEYGSNLASISDKATRERLMLGNWEYEDDPNSLMTYDSIIDIFTNTVEPSSSKFLTADVARYGGDQVVVMLWNGYESYKTLAWRKQGIDETARRINDLMISESIPRSRTIVDDDGVGGGVVDILRGVRGFVNNSSPMKDLNTARRSNYQNLKTQCYYMLADRINNRGLAVKNLPEEMKKKLIEDLEQVKRKNADKDGKLQLMSKEEVREVLGRSPDFSDALMMRMWFDLRPFHDTINRRQHVPSGLVRQLRPQLN